MRDADHARSRPLIGWGTAVLLVTSLLIPATAQAHPPPAGDVDTEPITIDQLVDGDAPEGLSLNELFAPSEQAQPASRGFRGTLQFAGSTMGVLSDGADGGLSNPVLGKDTTFFPDISVSLFTVDGYLVPTTQDVILNGVLPGTRSYWDVLVQPGRVWSEPGDGEWNRASFPFALVNSIEGETHNGIALFAYRGREVTPVRFQVTQMTSPFYVPEYFTAWGTSDVDFTPGGISRLRQRTRVFRAELAARLPVQPWSDLESQASPAVLAAYDEYSDVFQSAVVVDGAIYRTDCPTPAGPFPYCDEVRYGVWSVTKSAMMNAAVLRLAQKYGPGFFDEPIASYLPEAASGGWETVTFGDLTMMASGHGPDGDPLCYLCDYDRWYVALSEEEKTAEALDYPGPFAEPGTLFNYRDQDAYLLGVALDRYLEAQEGARASIWDLLRHEVYRPIGIYHAPTNATVEANGRRAGQPLMAYGYYPTLDDLAKISMLYQQGGRWNGRQILYPAFVEQILPGPTPPVGSFPANEDGSVHYYMNWWIQRLESADGCTAYVPQMSGWGGITVTVLPDDVVLMRLRNLWVDTPDPQATINALADEMVDFCP